MLTQPKQSVFKVNVVAAFTVSHPSVPRRKSTAKIKWLTIDSRRVKFKRISSPKRGNE